MTIIVHPFGIVYAEDAARYTAIDMKIRFSDTETSNGRWHEAYKCVKVTEFVEPTRDAKELLGRCGHRGRPRCLCDR